MPTIDNSVPSDLRCKCGRKLNEIHCTECGSFAVERRNKLIQVEIDSPEGKHKVLSKQWHCRRCSFKFAELTRIFSCNAALLQLSIKAQRAEDKIKEEIKKMEDERTLEQRKKDCFDELRKLQTLPTKRGVADLSKEEKDEIVSQKFTPAVEINGPSSIIEEADKNSEKERNKDEI